MANHTTEIRVDGVPYIVKAVSFDYNGEVRFRVSYNGSEEFIFTWDSSLGRLAAIGDESVQIPDNLEVEISGWLQSTTV